MTSVSSEITNMQNQTAYNNLGVSQNVKDNDSNMFLTLMLQQLQNQGFMASMFIPALMQEIH